MQKERDLIVNNLALSQISLIIIAIFAFAFMISEASVVSGQGTPAPLDFGDPGLSGSSPSSISPATSPVGSGSATSTLPPNLPPSEFPIGPTPDGTPLGAPEAAGGEGFSYLGINNPGLAYIAKGLVWAGIAYGVGQLLGSLLGLDEDQTNALSYGGAAGAFAYQAVNAIGPQGWGWVSNTGTWVGGAPGYWIGPQLGIGLAVGLVVFALTYAETRQKIVTFECLPWEAPLGGQNCEVCNEDPFRPCTEYRCRSLGQACELVNKGTIEESCVWVAKDDVVPPIITPAEANLTNGHSYTDHSSLPPSLGTKIINDNSGNECIQAFTPLTFGITLNEPGQCKIDYNHTESYDDMTFFFGESNYYKYEHSQTLSLPSPSAFEQLSPELQNNGIYDLYVRCRDANGNENVAEYAFEFCVDPSPDTTPPIIVSTSIPTGSPVSFNADTINVEFYINEPATCKWSVEDKAYSSMENTMTCANNILEVNSQSLYTCNTEITGIENNEDNLYYVRCQDQPGANESEKNTNAQSYQYLLTGTQPLNIVNATPNGETITGSTNAVEVELTVETSNGAKEGQAVCFFSPTGEEDTYVTMFNTDNYLHSQILTLTTGSYEYFFRCVDAGGNSDETTINFDVFVDKTPPMIAKIYKEGPDAVKIVTNEDADCVYSFNTCNYVFDEGLPSLKLPGKNDVNLIEWKPNSLYHLKCRDNFGNEPNPNECSMIISATNIKQATE